MKKKIKDLSEKEMENICGKYISRHCSECPLARPTYDECNYTYLQRLINHLESEAEVDE